MRWDVIAVLRWDEKSSSDEMNDKVDDDMW